MGGLIIHVGAGKTGTSAIQSFLWENLAELELRYHVPRSDTAGTLTHHRFADPSKEFANPEILGVGDKTSFLTSENFHSLTMRKEGVEHLAKIIGDLREHVQIIFILRRQSDWIESAINQWAKTGQLDVKPEVMANRVVRKNLVWQLRTFEELFGHQNIRVGLYEKHHNESSLSWPTEFARLLGFDASSWSPPENLASNDNTIHPSLIPHYFDMVVNNSFSKSQRVEILSLASTILRDRGLGEHSTALAPSFLDSVEELMSPLYRYVAENYFSRSNLFSIDYNTREDVNFSQNSAEGKLAILQAIKALEL